MSDEMKYVEDGEKQDAKLHDPILNNKAADKNNREFAIAHGVMLGLSEEEIQSLYGEAG